MKVKKTSLLGIILLVAAVIILSGCTTIAIKNAKDPGYVGKTVRVSGTVQNTIKIGELSGFTIKDETGTIGVSSQNLPAEGSRTSVAGVLMKDTIMGYYIKVS